MLAVKKINWFQKESLRLVIIFLPFVFLALFWTELPNRIPLHWNLRGEVDGYGSKLGFLGLASLNLLLFGLFLVLPHLDPKGKSHTFFYPKWHIAQVIIHLFFTYIFFLIGLTALGYKLPIHLAVKYGVIGLSLIAGTYLGVLPPNKLIGFKTPWTLRSNYVWYKTHRFAATFWVLTSFIMLIYDFWEKKYPWAYFVYLALLVVGPVIYSYFIYKQQPEANTNPRV